MNPRSLPPGPKFVGEHERYFVLHDGAKSFAVAKDGLRPATLKALRGLPKFDDGGQVGRDPMAPPGDPGNEIVGLDPSVGTQNIDTSAPPDTTAPIGWDDVLQEMEAEAPHPQIASGYVTDSLGVPVPPEHALADRKAAAQMAALNITPDGGSTVTPEAVMGAAGGAPNVPASDEAAMGPAAFDDKDHPDTASQQRPLHLVTDPGKTPIPGTLAPDFSNESEIAQERAWGDLGGPVLTDHGLVGANGQTVPAGPILVRNGEVFHAAAPPPALPPPPADYSGPFVSPPPGEGQPEQPPTPAGSAEQPIHIVGAGDAAPASATSGLTISHHGPGAMPNVAAAPTDEFTKEYATGFARQSAALDAQAQAAQKLADEKIALYHQQQTLQQTQFADLQRREAENQRLADEVANRTGHALDPDRWWNSRTPTQRMDAYAAMITGGLAQAFGGRNVGGELIQKAIANDLAAQKFDIEQGRLRDATALGYYVQRGHSIDDAYRFAVADANDLLASKINEASSRYDSAAALPGAQVAKGELMQRAAQIRAALAQKQNEIAMAPLNEQLTRAKIAHELASSDLVRLQRDAVLAGGAGAGVENPINGLDGKVYPGNTAQEAAKANDQLAAIRNLNAVLAQIDQLKGTGVWTDDAARANILQGSLAPAIAGVVGTSDSKVVQDSLKQLSSQLEAGNLASGRRDAALQQMRVLAATYAHSIMAAHVRQQPAGGPSWPIRLPRR